MAKLISYGNRIRRGKYLLHSTFKSAANFSSEDDFVFVVNRAVGAGPLNAVLEDFDPDTLSTLEVLDDYLCLNEERILFDDSTLYDSTFELAELDERRFGRNLQFFENTLEKLAPKKSLTFLIDDGREAEFSSIFELEFVKRCREGCAKIFSDDFLEGIKILKGLGPGLTPSGDDFISGTLIALNLFQKIRQVDYSKTIRQIYEMARGDNPFTNAFLDCAAQGLLFEKFKRLISALLVSNEPELIDSTKHLLEIGETSGADQAVGFIIGLKRF